MARIAEDETTRRWWQLTDPCQQPLDTAGLGEWWAPAEELFHLD
jgi:L-rhamnose mutarotase